MPLSARHKAVRSQESALPDLRAAPARSFAGPGWRGPQTASTSLIRSHATAASTAFTLALPWPRQLIRAIPPYVLRCPKGASTTRPLSLSRARPSSVRAQAWFALAARLLVRPAKWRGSRPWSRPRRPPDAGRPDTSSPAARYSGPVPAPLAQGQHLARRTPVSSLARAGR